MHPTAFYILKQKKDIASIDISKYDKKLCIFYTGFSIARTDQIQNKI